MPYAMVTVETASRGKADLALPLDVPSGALAARVMKDLGEFVRTGDAFAFFIKSGKGEHRIPADATLGEAGVLDRQELCIKKEALGLRGQPRSVAACLRTGTGEMLALDGDNMVIGRRDAEHQTTVEVDLSKYDPNNAVSRRHASIGRQGTEYYLIDLGSTNGTCLNGKEVPARQRTPLHDGDVIEFGRGGVRVTFAAGR